MLQIHATKKLFAKLPLDESGCLAEGPIAPDHLTSENNPLSGWHANLLTIQRRNCVLFVHDQTRFPLLIIGLLKKDFAKLNWLFEDALMNTLLKLEANQTQLDRAAMLLSSCRFDTVCDRSVQGTMNRMAGDFEHLLWFDNARIEDVSPYKSSEWLADRPCNIKSRKTYIWPKKEMLALLSNTSTLPTPQPSNVVKLSDFRR
jgi:hypothetical protein